MIRIIPINIPDSRTTTGTEIMIAKIEELKCSLPALLDTFIVDELTLSLATTVDTFVSEDEMKEVVAPKIMIS